MAKTYSGFKKNACLRVFPFLESSSQNREILEAVAEKTEVGESAEATAAVGIAAALAVRTCEAWLNGKIGEANFIPQKPDLP